MQAQNRRLLPDYRTQRRNHHFYDTAAPFDNTCVGGLTRGIITRKHGKSHENLADFGSRIGTNVDEESDRGRLCSDAYMRELEGECRNRRGPDWPFCL